MSASRVSERMESLSRPPVTSSPRPRRMNSPRSSARATPASARWLTTAARIRARTPSGVPALLRKSRSVTTSPSTVSPRNSSRSLVGMPPASWAKERWVRARTSSSGSMGTPSRSRSTSTSSRAAPAAALRAISPLPVVDPALLGLAVGGVLAEGAGEPGEGGPAGVDDDVLVVGRQVGHPLTAAGTQPAAALLAQRVQRQGGDDGVAQHGLQVDEVALELEHVLRLLVALGEGGLPGAGVEEELAHRHGAGLVDVAQAAHALAVDLDVDVAGDQHPLHDGLQAQVELHRGGGHDADDGGAVVTRGGDRALDRAHRAGPAAELERVEHEGRSGVHVSAPGSWGCSHALAAAPRYLTAGAARRGGPGPSAGGGLLQGGEPVTAGADLLGDRLEVDLELGQLPVAVVVGVPGELGRPLLGGGDDLLGTLVGERHDVLLAHQALGLLLRLLQDAGGALPGLGEHLLRPGEDVVGGADLTGDHGLGGGDEVQRLGPVDQGGGRHRHGLGLGDEVGELLEDGDERGAVVLGPRAGVAVGGHLVPPEWAKASRSAWATAGGTRPETSPSWPAMSLTREEAMWARAPSPTTNTVSTPARCRFIRAIGCSASKSAPPRSPLTMAVAPASRQ